MNTEYYDNIQNNHTKELMVKLLNKAIEFKKKRDELINIIPYGGDDDDFECESDVVKAYMENMINDLNETIMKLVDTGELNYQDCNSWISGNDYLITLDDDGRIIDLE